MASDVAHGRRPQQGVADSVGQHIAIGMADGSFFKGDVNAAQDQLASRGQWVEVVTEAHPEREW